MRLHLFIGLAVAGIFAAGCARMEPPAAPVLPETWRNAPRGPAEAGDRLVWPARWWESFNDPLLSDMVAGALDASPGIVAAAARLEAARALLRPIEANARPRLDASTQLRGESRLAGRDGRSSILDSRGSVSNDLVSSSESSSTGRNSVIRQAGFDASWEIDLFGRLAASRAAGEAEVEIAATDLSDARVTLVAEIVRSFADLRAAQRQMQLQAQQVALRERLAALAARRQKAGIGTDAEVERADAAKAEAVIRLAERAEAVSNALLRLAVLAGTTTPDQRLSIPAAPLRPARMALDALPADLLRNRPDIRRAEARVAEAMARVGIAQSEMLPRLSLTGSLTTAANVSGKLLPGPVTFLSGGPALTVPLFDWGGRRATRDARLAESRAMIEDHRRAVLEGYADAEAAIARLETARQRTDAAGQVRARAARAAARAARLRDAGLTAQDEEFETAAALLEADIEETEAQRAEAIAVAALLKALGGGPPNP